MWCETLGVPEFDGLFSTISMKAEMDGATDSQSTTQAPDSFPSYIVREPLSHGQNYVRTMAGEQVYSFSQKSNQSPCESPASHCLPGYLLKQSYTPGTALGPSSLLLGEQAANLNPCLIFQAT